MFGASSPVNISKQLPTSSTGSGSCSVNEGRELAKKSRNYLPKESSRTTSSNVVYNISDDSDVDSKCKVNRLKRCSRNQRSSEPDVICLDTESESDHRYPTSHGPILVDSQCDHHDPHDAYSDAASDSSELPEIPVLEPVDNVGYLPSATVDRAYEQGERILSDQFYFRQESVTDAYLADHRRPPEEHDEHVIEVRSEEEPCRSRHSSGDPGTSFDDPNDACWYSLLSAPEHTKPADQSVRKQLHNHCVSHFFSQDKYNVINGCLDEEFTLLLLN